jgi:heme exporter protein D
MGVRDALAYGQYGLYVWPAFGSRRVPLFGKLLGQVSFVVKLQ